ncbi:hypothetical protein F5884DRAFT_640416, partial [Xylogone sp. PMI_703]
VEFSIGMVIDRWECVSDYFGSLIGHRETLADPDAHDSLLFDDDSFSRSRRYFWAINYLAELDISIGENIVQLERCVATWPQYADFQFHEDRQTEKRSLHERLNQLRDMRYRLRTLRQDAIALRDGLFSASGVIESRAATRLGENIRLLTFVSIFFLPLSFCMSIWSISNTLFSLRALVIVSVIVGLVTYIIVFNLNSFVGLYSRIYDRRKQIIIEQMKNDDNQVWREYAKKFAAVQPKLEYHKASEWIIGSFLLHKAWK